MVFVGDDDKMNAMKMMMMNNENNIVVMIMIRMCKTVNGFKLFLKQFPQLYNSTCMIYKPRCKPSLELTAH